MLRYRLCCIKIFNSLSCRHNSLLIERTWSKEAQWQYLNISFTLLINFCYLKTTQCYHQLCVDDFVIYFNILGELVIIHLTFRRPCIVIYSYNKSQWDALFLKFIWVTNSTCFSYIYCPSSGVPTLYTQQLVFVMLVTLTASEVRMASWPR